MQIFKESFRKWRETQNGMQNVSKQFNYTINTGNNCSEGDEGKGADLSYSTNEWCL